MLWKDLRNQKISQTEVSDMISRPSVSLRLAPKSSVMENRGKTAAISFLFLQYEFLPLRILTA